MSKLALKGGNKLRTEGFPMWPRYDGKELAALERVLNSGKWGTLGGEVDRFAKSFAAYQHAKYGVAVTNGTVTLEVIMRALGIGYGDEVIIPPYTFNATSSAVIFQGATPVFADIEEDTFNIDPEKIEKAITSRTKAIIPVHLGGRACNMDRIMEIAKKHNLYVIEDSAHAQGSEWNGRRVGSIGHAGSFSFQASKNLTAGEGGFITTNDTDIYEKCWSIHHCGRDIRGKVWYDHPIVGTNARMTEWQAAILNTQLERLDEQIEKRMSNAAYLNSRLKEVPCVEILKEDKRITRNSHHIFIFRYKSEKCKGLDREVFLNALNAEGIPSSPGYVCLYKQSLFNTPEFRRITGSNINYGELYLEKAEKICGKEGVWLTQNMLLAEKKDIDQIAEAIIKIYENVDELVK
ncbi:MAG TPA: DegT/DnrJ/EryC1/StrS family aminotransferase [Clostridiales bacterium]|nr:DegT/DnrJ/EryC1/StrS family aminotransferase [Clostridiales bacterium]